MTIKKFTIKWKKISCWLPFFSRCSKALRVFRRIHRAHFSGAIPFIWNYTMTFSLFCSSRICQREWSENYGNMAGARTTGGVSVHSLCVCVCVYTVQTPSVVFVNICWWHFFSVTRFLSIALHFVTLHQHLLHFSNKWTFTFHALNGKQSISLVHAISLHLCQFNQHTPISILTGHHHTSPSSKFPSGAQ